MFQYNNPAISLVSKGITHCQIISITKRGCIARLLYWIVTVCTGVTGIMRVYEIVSLSNRSDLEDYEQTVFINPAIS